MKKLLGSFLIGLALFAGPKAAQALTGPFVQITSGTLQPGTTNGFYTSSGTVNNFNAPNIKSTGSWTLNGTTVTCSGAMVNGTLAIAGSTDGSSAAAGKWGESGSTATLRTASKTLTTNTTISVATFTFQAGDYDVWVNGCFQLNSGTPSATSLEISLSQTANTIAGVYGVQDGLGQFTLPRGVAFTSASSDDDCLSGYSRVVVNTATTYYITERATFASGSLSAYCQLRYRRASH